MNWGVPFSSDPDEIAEMQRKAKEQHDRAVMQAQDDINRIRDLLDNMSGDDLATTLNLLNRINSDESGRVGSYYEGMIASLLVYKHKRCACGGADHLDSEHLALQHDGPAQSEA